MPPQAPQTGYYIPPQAPPAAQLPGYYYAPQTAAQYSQPDALVQGAFSQPQGAFPIPQPGFFPPWQPTLGQSLPTTSYFPTGDSVVPQPPGYFPQSQVPVPQTGTYAAWGSPQPPLPGYFPQAMGY